MLYDEPIEAQTTAAGTPRLLIWRGTEFTVRAVCQVWQVAGGARLYRVGVVGPGDQRRIAEIVGGAPHGWRLRHLW